MTKKIAVIAVRIAVEIEGQQAIGPAADQIRQALNQAEEEGRIFNWDFDEWGADFDEFTRHIFDVADDFNGDEGLPQIRGRAVTQV